MIASKEREFQEDAKKWMASKDIKPVEPVLPIDAELQLSEVSSKLRNELSMLPYVKSAPKFSTHTVNIELMTPFKNKEHVVLKLNDDKGNTSYALKWYGMEAYRAAGSPRKGKVAGTLIPAKFAARSLGLHQDDTIIEIEDIQA